MMADKQKSEELASLREQLEGAKIDLYNYQKNASRDPLLKANYHHKKAQVETLEARIAEMETEMRMNGSARPGA